MHHAAPTRWTIFAGALPRDRSVGTATCTTLVAQGSATRTEEVLYEDPGRVRDFL